MLQYWAPLAVQDGAFLHTLISCAAAYLRTPDFDPSREVTATKHLNHAISIVNQRITNTEAVSKGTLVIVATIAMLEVRRWVGIHLPRAVRADTGQKSRGRHENWLIHMRGLEKLVQLFGGLSTLDTEPFVLGKILR